MLTLSCNWRVQRQLKLLLAFIQQTCIGCKACVRPSSRCCEHRWGRKVSSSLGACIIIGKKKKKHTNKCIESTEANFILAVLECVKDTMGNIVTLTKQNLVTWLEIHYL